MNYETIDIPATVGGQPGTVIREYGRAKVFFCLQTTDSFSVRPDNGQPLLITAGKGFGSSFSPEFDRLTFYNETLLPITVVYYAGLADYQASVQTSGNNVVSVSSALNYLQVDPDTYTPGATVPNGWVKIYPGTVGGRRRKYMDITNDTGGSHNNITVESLDVDGVTWRKIALVLGGGNGSYRRFDIAQDIRLRNLSGVASDLSVFEMF